ncbi:MAG: 30S ribosomal protein S8 [bacterium]|nr:30S ribosomal protein S8 [bacterium]
MTDPITDMLNRIRNAKSVQKEDVLVPFSRIKYEIAGILSRDGFVGEVKKIVKEKNKAIKITLKYDNGVSAISGLRRVSKPGQRIYSEFSELRRIRGGYGISVVSTSKGLKTNKEARKLKIGGEVICEVW